MRKFLAGVLVSLLLIAIVHIVNSLHSPIHGEKKKIKVERGSSLQEVAQQLKDENVIQDKGKFIFVTRLKGKVKEIKAGYFSTKKVKTYAQLVDLLTGYNPYTVKVTIPEGTTARGIAQILSPKFDFTKSEFLKAAQSSNLIDTLGIADIDKLEGYLYPNTYFFYPSSTPREIIDKMVNTLFMELEGKLAQQIKNSEMNLHETLTLASIVEGECVIDSERTIVSSLYHNRLEKRMHLNADPTIQYIVPGEPRRLLKKHLEIESPYNTYKNYGLPPGPVNNPGLKSIKAAVNPADTDYIYMVATGDGGHTFTVSYRQFLQEKEKFQNVRQKVRRNNK